jgi:D-glycero-D-manno-heptose 1,7-bisphosphate phosphatase
MIEEKHHLCDPEQVVLLPGAAALVSSAHSLGLPVVVVTNQAAIGYGKCGWDDLRLVQARIEELLALEGVAVDAVLACPFHAVAQPPYRHPDHPWRKPNPGMLLEAATLLNLALGQSILIGDKVSDIAAARSAGLPAACLVRTGHGMNHVAAAQALAGSGFRVMVIDSLIQAVPLL